MTDASNILLPGAVLGKYRILRPIGSGGMGTVYEGSHTDLGKRVAIKVLHPDVARNPVARARFQREGQAAARIHHPNVVGVFDVGTEGSVIYLVMEYLEGQDLSDRLQHSGRMEVAALCDLMLPVCLAVAAAHEAGVIHRDLKPENIFLAKVNGAIEPKLLDFGISKVPHGRAADLTLDATALGTPQYMSPEQVTRANRVDARSDLYTLGLILYECSVGRRAFDGADVYPVMHAVVEGDFIPPREVIEEIPKAFEAVILRAMARDPNDRFPSALALGRALLPFATQETRTRLQSRFDPSDHEDTVPLLQVAAPSPRELPSAPTSTLDASSLEIPIALSTRRPRANRPVLIVGGIATVLVVAAALVPSRSPHPSFARSPASLSAPITPAASTAPAASPEPLAPAAPIAPAAPTVAPTPVAPAAPPSALLALPPEPAAPEAVNVPMEPALPGPPAAAHRSLHSHTPRPAAPAAAPPAPMVPAVSPIAAPVAPTTPAVDLQRGANNAPIVE